MCIITLAPYRKWSIIDFSYKNKLIINLRFQKDDDIQDGSIFIDKLLYFENVPNQWQKMNKYYRWANIYEMHVSNDGFILIIPFWWLIVLFPVSTKCWNVVYRSWNIVYRSCVISSRSFIFIIRIFYTISFFLVISFSMMCYFNVMIVIWNYIDFIFYAIIWFFFLLIFS